MNYRPVILYLLLALVSCSSGSSKWTYEHALAPDTANTKYQLYDLYQDENGEKGIVVYNDVDPSTNEGSIFILSLDETECAWGLQDREVYPIDDEDLKGLVRTAGYTLYINQMVYYLGNEKYPAFQWCQDKNPQGERIHGSSWILPGFWEFVSFLKMTDLTRLNIVLTANGGTPLAGEDEYYWTASEDQEGEVTFRDGDPEYEPNWDYNPTERAAIITSDLKALVDKVYWSKSLRYHVRAVKYIYAYKPYNKGE